MAYVIIAILGILSGLVGAIVGLGGGVILVPLTLYFGMELGWIDGITPQTVVGLSVIMMVFTGLSSTLSHMKANTVDYKSGWLFFAGSVPGTILGAYLNKQLDLPSFNLYFGLLLIGLALILLLRDRMKPVQFFVKHGQQKTYVDKEGNTHVYGYPVSFALLLTFGIGLMSGLFGIGGGSMLVPAMLILFLFPPHVAVATSMFMVFLSALVNSASHIYLGNVPWLYTIPVIPAAWIGAKLGSTLNQKMDSKAVVTALRLVLLVLGLRSVYIGIWG